MTIATKSIILGVSIAGALVAAPYVAGHRVTYPVRRTRVAEMTTSERSRLENNLAEFLKLSPSAQEDLAKLHQEVEGDAILAAIRDEYNTWLRSLSTFDRQQVRDAGTDEERLALIRKLREPSLEIRIVRPGQSGGRAQPVKVPVRDFECALAVLEREMPEFLRRLNPVQFIRRSIPNSVSAQARARMLDLSDDDITLLRRVMLISTLLPERWPDSERRPGTNSSRQPRQPAFEVRAVDEAVVREVIDCFSKEAVREQLSSLPAAVQRAALGYVLLNGLRAPSEQAAGTSDSVRMRMKDAFVGLSDEQRDEVMRMPPATVFRRLQNNENPVVAGRLRAAEQRFVRMLTELLRNSPRGRTGRQ